MGSRRGRCVCSAGQGSDVNGFRNVEAAGAGGVMGFDLMYAGGSCCWKLPLRERRNGLEAVVEELVNGWLAGDSG